MKVVIAEDDFSSRSILMGILPRWGYEVVAVPDGLQALESLNKPQPPKLVILDWMMPGMDGVDVCRALRRNPSPEPPYIILLTAKEQKEHTVLGLQAGANDYITKPYDPNELQARLAVGRRVVELQEALVRRVEELEAALTEIRTLRGILPICMHCHKIRNDEESWEQIETYIAEHSSATFSHGICPACMEKYYPEAMRQSRMGTAGQGGAGTAK